MASSAVATSENAEVEYQTTDDSDSQHLNGEVSRRHHRSSMDNADDDKIVMGADLDQQGVDRGTQRKGKVTDKVMKPQAITESVNSIQAKRQSKTSLPKKSNDGHLIKNR